MSGMEEICRECLKDSYSCGKDPDDCLEEVVAIGEYRVDERPIDPYTY